MIEARWSSKIPSLLLFVNGRYDFPPIIMDYVHERLTTRKYTKLAFSQSFEIENTGEMYRVHEIKWQEIEEISTSIRCTDIEARSNKSISVLINEVPTVGALQKMWKQNAKTNGGDQPTFAAWGDKRNLWKQRRARQIKYEIKSKCTAANRGKLHENCTTPSREEGIKLNYWSITKSNEGARNKTGRWTKNNVPAYWKTIKARHGKSSLYTPRVQRFSPTPPTSPVSFSQRDGRNIGKRPTTKSSKLKQRPVQRREPAREDQRVRCGTFT